MREQRCERDGEPCSLWWIREGIREEEEAEEDPCWLAGQAERILLNLLEPLRRVKVAKGVQFIWGHGMDGLEAIDYDEADSDDDFLDKDDGSNSCNDGSPCSAIEIVGRSSWEHGEQLTA